METRIQCFLVVVIFIAFGCTRKIQEYYNQGIAKKNIEDFEGAKISFTKAIEIDSSFAEAFNQRGLVELSLGDYVSAYADFCKTKKLEPSFAEAYYNLGYLKQQHFEKEKSLFASESGQILWFELDKAIELDPKNAKYYFTRGSFKSLLKEHKDAILDFTKAIENDSNFAVAYFKRGKELLLLSEDLNKAMEDLNKAIGLDSSISEAYHFRAYGKLQLNDTDGALHEYNKAIEICKEFDFHYYFALLERGELKTELKDDFHAISDYNIVIRKYLHESESKFGYLWKNATLGRAKSKYNLKDYRGAIMDLDTLIIVHPEFSDAFAMRARVLWHNKRIDNAITDLNKAIELDNKNAFAFYLRGMIKIDIGQKESGCLDLSKAGELGFEDAYRIIKSYCL